MQWKPLFKIPAYAPVTSQSRTPNAYAPINVKPRDGNLQKVKLHTSGNYKFPIIRAIYSGNH